MAKYDEFGRPIYETAEEYNRARRAGNNSRTYDSPEGDRYQHTAMKETYRNQSAAERYATRTGSKKAKTMVLGLVVFFIVLNVVIVFSMFNMVRGTYDDYQEFEESWIDLDDDGDGYGEYIGDDATPLPEGFETFSYNGQTYTLPTTFEEIDKMGFSLEEDYDESYMFTDEYEELLTLSDEDGFMYAMVRVNNYTGEEIPLGKCLVDYFYMENPNVFDEEETVPDFVFGDGLTFESSYDDVEAYFGIPYYHYEDHSDDYYHYDLYEWAYYGEDEIHFVSVTFLNSTIDNISIEKTAYEEKY